MHKATCKKLACLAMAFLTLWAGSFAVLACPPEEAGGYILTVQNIKQYGELPNGCEITSLAILLNYIGYEVSKTDLADNYLPRTSSWRGADPETIYVGNPRNSTGWYCWAPAIVAAADAYFADVEADLAGLDITGADAQLIQDYISCHMPVVAWVTIDWSSSLRKSRSYSWTLADGTRYTPYTNVHCLVITGYDDEHVYVANPLNDETAIEAALFWEVFEAVGSRAMVVQAAPGK